MPRVSVFTPFYNKGDYLFDALGSLQSQTMRDWEWWIMDNSTDNYSRKCSRACATVDKRVHRELTRINDVERMLFSPMPYLLNRYYPQASGDIIVYLSDDDLFRPGCFQMITDFMDANPDKHVCYFTLQLVTVGEPGDTGPWPFNHGIGVTGARGLDTVDWAIDQFLDGGQIAHRKNCLDVIEQPWFPETAELPTAAHCDGIFMDKLAKEFTFWPVGDRETPQVVHRYNPLSTWHSAEEIPGGVS